MRVVDVSLETSRVELDVAECHLQPFGIVHGGVIATLVDTATFWAGFGPIAEDAGLVNVDLKLNYLQTVSSGRLIASGRSIRAGRTMSYTEAYVRTEDDRLIAHGTSTLMTLPGKGIPVGSAQVPVIASRRAVVAWLYAGCILIALLVTVGGVTRLTGSGLSITEWNVLMGALPPLDAHAWQALWEKYQATPQYQQVNTHFTLAQFKSIFWWEYIHRLLARLLGVVFLVPFLWFLARGTIWTVRSETGSCSSSRWARSRDCWAGSWWRADWWIVRR